MWTIFSGKKEPRFLTESPLSDPTGRWLYCCTIDIFAPLLCYLRDRLFGQPLIGCRVGADDLMESVALAGSPVFLEPGYLHGNFTFLQPNGRVWDASCPSAGMGGRGVQGEDLIF